MRVILQRVSQAHVVVKQELFSGIGSGILLLVAFSEADKEEDISRLSAKLVQLRIFNDQSGIMNLSIRETGGDILVVSQFTLFASTRKGNRPSYSRSANRQIALPLYEKLIGQLSLDLGKPVSAGQFGEDMQVSLVNDGPVTIIMDTHQWE
ncbi:MAG TPA: D-aminoacyl-tRNA deacylase [Chitinophagaceae bacterium]|nr:D-aminoacyl-tRNA deacylase [Chitinophagaceae bacterium]